MNPFHLPESRQDLRLVALWTVAALGIGVAANWLAILWMAGRFSFE